LRRKTVPVVVLLVRSLWSMRCASRVRENSSVHAGRGTVSSGVVHLIVLVVVVVVVVIVVVVTSLYFQKPALGKFLDFILILTLLLDTVVQSLLH